MAFYTIQASITFFTTISINRSLSTGLLDYVFADLEAGKQCISETHASKEDSLWYLILSKE